MTKNDYELIASVIRTWRYSGQETDALVNAFSYHLGSRNPRFDTARFTTACLGKATVNAPCKR